MSAIQVAIVGAGGQVGKELLTGLGADARFKVWGICRNNVTAAPLRVRGVEVRLGSVTDNAAQLVGNAEVVVNCAAASGLPLTARVENEKILSALCALPGRRRLVHFSSVAVYGWCINSAHSTYEHPRPNWGYGDDKLYLERFLARHLSPSHEAVLLRMGHVYGAGQWLSRAILTIIADPARSLAFDGALPSNAVHVRNVVAAVAKIATNWKSGTLNLVNVPPSNWREIFDWHTNAIGIPAIPSLGQAESQHAAEYYGNRALVSPWTRLFRESKSWLRSLPGNFVDACPTSKQVLLTQVTRFRARRLERRLLLELTRRSAGAGVDGPPIPEPWLLSQGMPGPQVAYESHLGDREVRELVDWHTRWARPDSILYGDTLSNAAPDLNTPQPR